MNRIAAVALLLLLAPVAGRGQDREPTGERFLVVMGQSLVDADDKRRARLNCIAHLLSLIDYEDLTPPPLVLPARGRDDSYIRPPLEEQTFVPQVY